MKKVVSVIVPVYNVEKFIFKTVNSILNQDYKNIEIILVDDGSPDNSAKIIDELAKKDNRIVCVHKENGGVSSARNAGLKIATGEYVTFIDGDDWVEPNYVSYLLNLVEKNKCEIGMNKNNYSNDNMNSSDREYVVSDEKAIEWIYLGNIFVAVWNKIYSMPFLKKNNILFDEKIWYGEGMLFNIDWPELPFAHREHIGCTVDYVAGRNRYMGYLISLGIYSFKGVKVGLDCANGSSWNIAKSVFDALGADTYVINNQPNGTNINTNAGSTHIEGLQKFVVEKGLDVGFAFDGDADRCLCVDEKGNVITGDHILYIYGCYMKERGKLLTNTVVTTVMSNFGLYKAFDEQGIGYAKTAVGDKYVYEYMAKNGCRIGGEQSGHIIFSKYASTGDGILTSLKMMEVMLAKKKPMSELAAPLKIYPQVLENVRVTDKKAAQNDPAVQEAVSKVAEALGDTGRILVRESGTEPVVRVMVEAPDHDTCQKYVDEVVNVICEKGYKA